MCNKHSAASLIVSYGCSESGSPRLNKRRGCGRSARVVRSVFLLEVLVFVLRNFGSFGRRKAGNALKRYVALSFYLFDKTDGACAHVDPFEYLLRLFSRHAHLFNYVKSDVLTRKGMPIVLTKEVTKNSGL